ncbi:hypothetical protein [Streptomyces aurantiogriseus]|uniref:Uncharacterized protein n=1 Tax=Streptomyces aurantiogriseus TaxID=66870 RepID=A0A918KYF7_9ACTN|nr:hypothetical protein [Streptomyces aurantiogriseus]GGR44895.1 hypothetical protein GCM10010251_72400 [Streptomyces aurantiogriseus]
MGTFYGNVLVGRRCEEVVPLLADADITAYALPVGPAHTAIHPDPETSAPDLAGPLSKLLGAPTVGTYVFDSDVLVMLVFEDGALRLHYDSWPGYFEEPETDENGDPRALEEEYEFPEPVGVDPDAFLPFAAGPVDRAALESALRGTPLDPEDGDDGRYVFANAQHYDVMACLGLNAPRLTTGHRYLSWGDMPYETPVEEVLLLGGARPPSPSRRS